ncbi:MAG: putative dsRNA-binding protein [Firmicutes bacterium]|nr:putative dsRNA-binding protein [Bacillota bacterium]
MVEFDYKAVENILGLTFNDRALLKRAFTHSSYSNAVGLPSNERLEYLGDSVVNLIVAEYLYALGESASGSKATGGESAKGESASGSKVSSGAISGESVKDELAEGELTIIRAKLVRDDSLHLPIKNLGLYKHLLLAYGEKKQNLHTLKSLQADLFESIVAAIYLQSGYDKAREFVKKHLLDGVDIKSTKAGGQLENYKGKLQEYLQARNKRPPVYKILEDIEVKETNSHIFTVGIYIDNKLLAKAQGSKKAQAEQECARLALKMLKKKK